MRFKAKDYMKKNNRRACRILIQELCLLSAIIYFLQAYHYRRFILPGIWLIGSRMNAIRDNIGHEASHYNLFSRYKRNRRGEWIYFIPLFDTFRRYQKEHREHHQYLGDEKKDPTIVYYYQNRGLYKPGISIFRYRFVRPFLFFDVINIGEYLYSSFRDNKEFRRKITLFRTIVIAMSVIFSFSYELLLYRFVPFFRSKPAFEFRSETADHYEIPKEKGKTRTMGGWFFTRLVKSHNDAFHDMHHRFPGIPGANIKKAYKERKKSEGIISKNYSFCDVYKEIEGEGK